MKIDATPETQFPNFFCPRRFEKASGEAVPHGRMQQPLLLDFLEFAGEGTMKFANSTFPIC